MSEELPRTLYGIVGRRDVDSQPNPTYHLCAFDFLRVRPWPGGTIAVEFTPQRDVADLDMRRGRVYYISEWAAAAKPLSKMFPYITSEYHGFLEYMTHSDGTPSACTVGHGVFHLNEGEMRKQAEKSFRHAKLIDHIRDHEAPA